MPPDRWLETLAEPVGGKIPPMVHRPCLVTAGTTTISVHLMLVMLFSGTACLAAATALVLAAAHLLARPNMSIVVVAVQVPPN